MVSRNIFGQFSIIEDPLTNQDPTYPGDGVLYVAVIGVPYGYYKRPPVRRFPP